MRNAVHKLRINSVPCASSLLRAGRLCGSIFRTVDGDVSGYCLLYQSVCLADSVGYGTDYHFFAVKPIHRNLCVGSYNDTVRLLNILIREYVLRTAGSARLDLDIAAVRFCRLFDSLRSHIGVGNSRGAGRHCQQLLLTCHSAPRIREPLVDIRLFLISPVHDFQKFLHTGCVPQILGKLLIHKHDGQLAQHVQVYIVLCVGSGDQENQRNRLVVQCLEVHAVLHHHRRQTGTADRAAFSVGDCNTLSDSRRALLLTGIDLRPVGFLIPYSSFIVR